MRTRRAYSTPADFLMPRRHAARARAASPASHGAQGSTPPRSRPARHRSSLLVSVACVRPPTLLPNAPVSISRLDPKPRVLCTSNPAAANARRTAPAQLYVATVVPALLCMPIACNNVWLPQLGLRAGEKPSRNQASTTHSGPAGRTRIADQQRQADAPRSETQRSQPGARALY